MAETISDPPVSWLLEARDRHCPTTNFSASLRCNRNVATGYLDEEESRAFAATEGTGLIYSFQTSPKEGEEINGSRKEDRVREVPMSFNAFACALCRAPPTASTTFLCEAALYVDCCKGIERQQLVQVEAEASDGGGSVLWLTDKSGERVRTLDRVLLGLLRHCFPLVVLRLPASLPTPSLKEKDGVVVEDVPLPLSNPPSRLVAFRRGSTSSALARPRLAGDSPTVQSQRQFQYVWELGGEARRRLERIVCGAKVGSDEVYTSKMLKAITRLVGEGAKDAEIYAELYRVYHHEILPKRQEEEAAKAKQQEEEAAKKKEEATAGGGAAVPATPDKGCGCSAGGGERAQARVAHILGTLPRGFKPDSVLDIGCADGSITVKLGKEFNVPRKNIHGCDVRDMAVVEGEGEGKGQGKAEGDRGFEFTLLRGAQCRGGDLPYEDGSFGLVTLLMTLHHLEDQLEALWEIERLLKPDGIVVIREHQCNERGLDVVLDIMHGLYALVWNAVPETPTFIQDYFALYRPREEWSAMMQQAGLTRVHWVPYGRLLYDFAEPNPKKQFDMVHVNPSKAYYAAYQKKAKLPSPPEKGRPRSRSNSSGGHDWRHSHPRETERVPSEEPARGMKEDRKRSRSPEKGEASSSEESSDGSKGLSKKERKRLKKEKKKEKKEAKKEAKKRRKEEKKADR